MEWQIAALVVFGALFALFAAGIPIAFSMGLVGIVGLLVLLGVNGVGVIGEIAYLRFGSYLLSPLPLFILMGEVLVFSGVSTIAYAAILKWMGFIPGGLAVTAVASCAAFAAISGSSPATTATIGVVAIPEMLERKYDKSLATGCVSAGGALGILIPPSLLMIIYGVVAEQSVAHLFMGGFIPGFILTGLMILYIITRCSLKPSLGPRGASFSWREKVRSTPHLLPVVILAGVVLGAIYSGIATPTEAAGLGLFGALVSAAIFRKLTWQNLRQAAIQAATINAFIITIFLGASILCLLLSCLYVPQSLCIWISSLGVSHWWILTGIMVMYMILGCLMDPGGILLLTAPIVIPIAISLGWDLIWLGILITINMEMANITPPVGFNLYIMKGIVGEAVSLADIFYGIWPFVVCQACVLALVAVFPQLALWLPSTMVF